jgi:hypothetical protein
VPWEVLAPFAKWGALALAALAVALGAVRLVRRGAASERELQIAQSAGEKRSRAARVMSESDDERGWLPDDEPD